MLKRVWAHTLRIHSWRSFTRQSSKIKWCTGFTQTVMETRQRTARISLAAVVGKIAAHFRTEPMSPPRRCQIALRQKLSDQG
ncbi:hypothetical protein KCP73_12905 [Salmonella enterica subsp. enterica]|nr:hypothetical protein KCP73_12905 [Salmonella enterica subsp. enterica]